MQPALFFEADPLPVLPEAAGPGWPKNDRKIRGRIYLFTFPEVLAGGRGARSAAGVENGTRRSGLPGFGPKTCSLNGFGPKFGSPGRRSGPRTTDVGPEAV